MKSAEHPSRGTDSTLPGWTEGWVHVHPKGARLPRGASPHLMYTTGCTPTPRDTSLFNKRATSRVKLPKLFPPSMILSLELFAALVSNWLSTTTRGGVCLHHLSARCWLFSLPGCAGQLRRQRSQLEGKMRICKRLVLHRSGRGRDGRSFVPSFSG